jgi:hypothetical protein
MYYGKLINTNLVFWSASFVTKICRRHEDGWLYNILASWAAILSSPLAMGS